ncbi:hypothetical protein, partial [Pantoea vagans]|uniref:hypothetical protein n=1 Tax=Pantoea vagans TaxID=470934 RepID=UPI0028B0AE34
DEQGFTRALSAEVSSARNPVLTRKLMKPVIKSRAVPADGALKHIWRLDNRFDGHPLPPYLRQHFLNGH